MKKIAFCFLIAVIFSIGVCAQTPSADIAFEKRIHNFGTVNEAKGKVSYTFVFENKGKTPVLINDIYSDCGCIAKVVTKEAVKPGSKGKVTITFDPSYRSGFFSKEVVVYSNNSKNYNRIWVEGNIIPTEHPVEDYYPYNFGDGLYLRLKVMAFGYVKPGETKKMELHYANATNKAMLLSFEVKGNQKGLEFKNPGKIAAKGRGVITFSYTMPSSTSTDVSFTVNTYVNRKKLKETLEVKILNEKLLNKK